MGKYLGSTGLTYLWGKIKSIFATKTEVSAKANVGGVLFPNFDGMTPVKVIEYDKAASNYSRLFTRTNTGISADMSEVQDVVLMRITVTGTNIYSRSDVVIKFQPGLVNPHAYAFHHTYSDTAATTGLEYLRFNYPKALNNNIPWMVDFYQYNATSRHYKIEVFSTTENITWDESLTATTYSSSNYNTAQITLYTTRGLVWLGTLSGAINTASAASYVNAYQNKYIGQASIKAGETLASYDITFVSNGSAYKISNKNIPIDPEYGICAIGTATTQGSNVGYAYYRQIWSFTFASCTDTFTKDSFVQGDRVYLRCTMRDGKIYSDGHLSNKMTAGYTWYMLGVCYTTANSLAMNTEGSFFLTLDGNGLLSHINGKMVQTALLMGGAETSCDQNEKDSLSDISASIVSAKGRSFVFNQMQNTPRCQGTGNNSWQAFPSTQFSAVANHKYLVKLSDWTDINQIRMRYPSVGSNLYTDTILTITTSGNCGFQWHANSGKAIDTYINVFDLTRMFGAGKEPATVAEFNKLFPLSYYAYSTGMLLSGKFTGFKSLDANSNTLSELSIPITTLTGIPSGGTSEIMFADGLNGIDTTRDEINFETGTAIKRIGSRAYNSSTDTGNDVLTDGTTTYYVLDTPIEYTIDNVPTVSYVTKQGGKEKWLPENTHSTTAVATIDWVGKYGIDVIQEIRDLESSKQDALVSGTNIKTINNESILGSGNITIGGTGSEHIHVYHVTHNEDYVENLAKNYVLDSTAITTQDITTDINNGVLPVIIFRGAGHVDETFYLSGISWNSAETKQDYWDFCNPYAESTYYISLEDNGSGSVRLAANAQTCTMVQSVSINGTSKTPGTNGAVSFTGLLDTSSTAQTKSGNLTAAKFITSGSNAGEYVLGDGTLGDDYRRKLTKRWPLQVNNYSGAYLKIDFGTGYIARDLILIELVSFDNSHTYIDRYAFSKINNSTEESGWGLGVVQLLSSTRTSSFTILYGYTNDDAVNPDPANRTLWIAIPHNAYGCLSITEGGWYSNTQANMRDRGLNALAGITVTSGLSLTYNNWLSDTVKLLRADTANPLSVNLASKQDSLVSGTNIKTINNESILGSGNITIQGGGGGDANVTIYSGTTDPSSSLGNNGDIYVKTS